MKTCPNCTILPDLSTECSDCGERPAPDVDNWRDRQAREYELRMDALCHKLGHAELERIVAPLVERCKVALAAGDEHLNTITLATWDRLAGVQGSLGGPKCCGFIRGSKHCPDCGKQLRTDKPDGRLWPYSELRETARAEPWRKAPGLSLSERVGALKHTARRLALG